MHVVSKASAKFIVAFVVFFAHAAAHRMLSWLIDGALLPENVPWMALTLGGSAFFALLELCLDVRQINQLRRDSLPPVLHEYLRPEAFRQMQAWNIQRMTFLRAESTLAWLLESAILYFHLLPYFWTFSLRVLDLLAPNAHQHRIVRGLVFIFVVSFFSSLVKMPGELYRYLRIDSTRAVRIGISLWMESSFSLLLSLLIFAVERTGEQVFGLIIFIIFIFITIFFFFCFVFFIRFFLLRFTAR